MVMNGQDRCLKAAFCIKPANWSHLHCQSGIARWSKVPYMPCLSVSGCPENPEQNACSYDTSIILTMLQSIVAVNLANKKLSQHVCTLDRKTSLPLQNMFALRCTCTRCVQIRSHRECSNCYLISTKCPSNTAITLYKLEKQPFMPVHTLFQDEKILTDTRYENVALMQLHNILSMKECEKILKIFYRATILFYCKWRML